MDASAVVSPPYLAAPLRLQPFRAHLLQPSQVGDGGFGRLLSRPYRAVAARLRTWQERGLVTPDTAPAVYLHEYVAEQTTVRGFVGALDLRRRAADLDHAVVLPHEGVHAGQVEELAARMAQMQLQPAPILLVHEGTPALRALVAEVRETPPGRQFVDATGQRHRLWMLRSEHQLDRLAEAIAPARALVADGHHRYAAYLRLQAGAPDTAADAGLAILIDHTDTPLRLRAAHRVLAGVGLTATLAALADLDITVEFRPGPSLNETDPNTIVLAGAGRWAVARLPASEMSAVEFVHRVIVPALPRQPRSIATFTDAEEAVATACRRQGTAMLLAPPTFEQVFAAARAGRLLPQKATSFQPKPSMGVLMRSLRDG